VLPGKKISFLIVPENGSGVREFKLSALAVVVAGCLALFVVTAAAYIVHDYIKLSGTMPSKRVLILEVSDQRAQLEVFAHKIQALNEELVGLRELEEKIRVVANVKEPADKDAVFGIGGTMPEELHITEALAERHNGLIRDMHAGVDYLDQAISAEREAFEELHTYLQEQRSLLASTPSIRPTAGWLSSRFGHRISPFTGLEEFHRGIDIATREGKPIIAPADGRVTFVGNNGGLGKTLVVDHGHGTVTRYAHLKECLVEPGYQVKRGDKIALVGNSGRSTGPHLHYEVHLNGIPVDPEKYILN
jgi:murein DD-endopeptidase MepM/ murein hydrolase activator NlpD